MFRNYANHARTDSETCTPPSHLDADVAVLAALTVAPFVAVLLVSDPAAAVAVAFGFVVGRRTDGE
jgi:hypothetical protein